MILTAEHLLHVLRIHKCFSTVPSSVILTPNKMESNKSVMKYVKDIVYYLSGGDLYDAATLQGVLNCYIVRKYSWGGTHFCDKCNLATFKETVYCINVYIANTE